MSGSGRLRVGLDLLFLGERAGGVGRYATELAAALVAGGDVELTLFTSRTEPGSLRREPWAGEARIVQLPVSGGRALLAAQLGGLGALALARRLDVLHGPANAGAVKVPGVRCVITVHDLIWRRLGADWGSPAALAAMERLVPRLARRADRVITDSEAAAADLAALLGVPAERTDVVPLGVRVPAAGAATARAELSRRLGIGPGRIVLCVGQKRPYKRQELLVDALASLPSDVELVLPGAPTPYEDELRRRAGDAGVAGRVHFPAWVSEADLEGLYRAAACVAIPTQLEGFGLPVLEALARGAPVVCSDDPALGEVAGDAALRTDAAGFAAALQRVLEDPALAARLSAAGPPRASQFTWARTAALTVEAYRRTSMAASDR